MYFVNIQRIELVKRTCVNHTTDPIAPVSYLHLDELKLVDKDVPKDLSQKERLEYHGVKVCLILYKLVI